MNAECEPKEGELLPADLTALEGIVWKKLDRRLIPLCTGWFVLALVDGTNISSSRVVGLQQALKISNYQYTIALTVTNVFNIVSQFPSTLLLKYVGPDIMLPAMVMLWGAIAASQGFVDSASGLIACRALLGMAEGGVFPGIVLYLSLFYPRKRLQLRIATFFATTNLCATFAGLLAAAIDRMNAGGKPGWAWIFILEGLFTIVFGLISFFLLPRSPDKACFLTEQERKYVVLMLKRSGSVSEDEHKDKFRWIEIVNSAKSLHVWLLVITSFLAGTMLFSLVLFEPSIVVGLGYTGDRALLMSVPPVATNFVWSLVTGFISDHYRCRGYTLICLCFFQLAGFVMFYASRSNHVRYASLFLSLPGTFCMAPTLTTWLSNNSAPHTRRAVAIAMGSIAAQVGSVFSPWLLGYISPAPNYSSAMITYIAMSIGTIVLSTVNLAYLWRENRSKAKRRENMRREDEPEGLGDRSAWFIYSL